VVNGVAVVEGGNAPRAAPISWEDSRVTQANNGGNFAFQGVVPADCVGRLEDGVAADAIDVALANCIPVPPSPEFPAPVPKTGQATLYRPGDDGDLQAGVAWPIPHFTDRGDGTVRDNLTGLVWLKNAGCFSGSLMWEDAVEAAHTLANGQCGLTDGSIAGDWRLPNVKELLSLQDYGRWNPTLPVNHPFVNVQHVDAAYWSSTTVWHEATGNNPSAWWVDFRYGANGFVVKYVVGSFTYNTWPVRGPDGP
jgi:Protein of unknown function (DUF1566)